MMNVSVLEVWLKVEVAILLCLSHSFFRGFFFASESDENLKRLQIISTYKMKGLLTNLLSHIYIFLLGRF